MDKMNTDGYFVEKIRMPVNFTFTDSDNKSRHECYNPDSLFAVTLPKGREIRNGIGRIFKKHNIIDYRCLHGEPDESSLEQIFAAALLYKCECGGFSETASDKTTVSMVCGKRSEEFFKGLDDSGHSAVKCGKGIYRVNMSMLIDAYVIISSELGRAEKCWMEKLTAHARECREVFIDCPGCSFNVVKI